MNENENLVAEQVAENVEKTTEETPKLYTEEELQEQINTKANEIAGRRVARKEAKIRREYEQKYGGLEEVLKAGTGNKTVEEVTDTFKKYYEAKGIQIPKKPDYSEKDIEVLAKADAQDIIRAGEDEVTDEVNRLTALGAAGMTDREKAVFKALTAHQQDARRNGELIKLGVTEEVYNSKEFKDFAGKFHSDTPMADIYDIYSKTQPKKEVKTMGSMKNNTSADGTVKDFYTRDEALKFKKADFDKNPALFKAVEASMRKW